MSYKKNKVSGILVFILFVTTFCGCKMPWDSDKSTNSNAASTTGADTTTATDTTAASDTTSALNTIQSGSNIELVAPGHPPVGFNFVTGKVETGSGDFTVTGGDAVNGAYIWLDTGVGIIDLGIKKLLSVTEAPLAGYTSTASMGIYLAQGHSYVFKLANGKYAVIEIISVSVDTSTLAVTLRFDYKYQSDGSRNF